MYTKYKTAAIPKAKQPKADKKWIFFNSTVSLHQFKAVLLIYSFFPHCWIIVMFSQMFWSELIHLCQWSKRNPNRSYWQLMDNNAHKSPNWKWYYPARSKKEQGKQGYHERKRYGYHVGSVHGIWVSGGNSRGLASRFHKSWSVKG